MVPVVVDADDVLRVDTGEHVVVEVVAVKDEPALALDQLGEAPVVGRRHR